ncbi:FtsW/RodA/SpoVE family cell cycle protein [Abyssicoccus albus]|uniref:Probable peptidoglycan glycosyltransferase FtsW n=1 Tax=Abyssicoccus albus TaxID=1817405 RepID=A0A3N5BK33_9BACL|nr:FtsW/RodA/SpoVE family cell cycle protein [Abyssicoccus albus]RPF58234.1 cell division-specific peptidoglycan biosynthesis regulator FtsW [Abyssicoccus albus]
MIRKAIKKFTQDFKYVDFSIFAAYILICLIGLVMIYSASMIGAMRGTLVKGVELSPYHFFIRQLIYWMIGLMIVVFIGYIINIKSLLKKNIQIAMMASILFLLVLTLLIGREVNGAKSWIDLFGFGLQPSELFKIVSIIYLAYMYNQRKKYTNLTIGDILSPLTLVGVGLIFIAIQPDFGTAMILAIIIFSMVLYSGFKTKLLLSMVAVFICAIGVWMLSNYILTGEIILDHQKERFIAMQNPFVNEAEGYHLANSLVAFGTGGLFGNGLGNSIQKLGYLPEPHTDFILAVIGEEFGLFGVLTVLFILAFIVFKGFYYAMQARSTFLQLVCVGCATYIGIQTIVNVGGVTNFIPLTGVPLPFLSYGGSSMISLSIAVGLLLMASKWIRKSQQTTP